MLRSALASRYGISPLGRGVIRPASGGWWLSGGIAAANCIAAYQAKGAADYAASLVNLANPGTYNCTAPAGNPAFDTSVGLTFGSSKYLATGITPGAGWSFIVDFTESSGATEAVLGSYGSTNSRFFVLSISDKLGWGCGGYFNKSPAFPDGVVCLSGNYGYRDGTAADSLTRSWSGTPNTIYIGALNNGTAAESHFDGVIRSVAIYDAEITTAQVAAVTTAMAAL